MTILCAGHDDPFGRNEQPIATVTYVTGELFAFAALLMFSVGMITTRVGSGKLNVNTGFMIAISVNIAFAAILFGGQIALRGEIPRWDWLGFLIFVVAGGFSTYLGRWFLYEAIAKLGPAKTSAFQVTSPLFTMVIAWIVLGERLEAMTLGAMAVALAGLVLVSAPPKPSPGTGADAATAAGTRRRAPASPWRRGLRALSGPGALLGVGSSAAYAIGNVLRGYAIRQWDEVILGGLLGALAAMMLQLMFGSGNVEAWRSMRTADRTGILLFAASGMLTISGQMCVIAALRHTPVAIVALITLCTPLLVFPMSYFLLKNEEGINARTVTGGLLTLAGIALIIVR